MGGFRRIKRGKLIPSEASASIGPSLLENVAIMLTCLYGKPYSVIEQYTFINSNICNFLVLK